MGVIVIVMVFCDSFKVWVECLGVDYVVDYS